MRPSSLFLPPLFPFSLSPPPRLFFDAAQPKFSSAKLRAPHICATERKRAEAEAEAHSELHGELDAALAETHAAIGAIEGPTLWETHTAAAAAKHPGYADGYPASGQHAYHDDESDDQWDEYDDYGESYTAKGVGKNQNRGGGGGGTSMYSGKHVRRTAEQHGW